MNNENWDLEITPKKSLLDINLAELWNYRFLIGLFVRRDFVAQYKQTILGPVWHVLQPIFTTAIFLLVFGRIAGIPTDGVPPVLFYVTGITMWNYFATTVVNTSSTFVTNASIFGKVYFPRLVIPLSITISGLIKLGVQFLLVVAAMIWYHFKGFPIQPSAAWLLLPVFIVIMAGIGLGVGIIISSLTTKYRDMSILLSFVVQLGMYATPIAYPYSFLENRSYAWLIGWNPLTSLVEAFRHALFNQPIATDGLLYSVMFMIIVMISGVIIFNNVERSFMDTV
ncbi:MAG TPA: ABC transporter permease [Cyclobacteriaceae bacterium]|nr:ABC transporter permease [Cyclobacteriaceae bacterium]